MMQNKVAAAFARKGLTLRRGFELLDTSRSGEVAFEDFITGILEMDGHFSPEQLRHLLASLERGQEHAALRHAVGRWAAARRRELWAHGKMASPK